MALVSKTDRHPDESALAGEGHGFGIISVQEGVLVGNDCRGYPVFSIKSSRVTTEITCYH
jgi:hypothetical protein